MTELWFVCGLKLSVCLFGCRVDDEKGEEEKDGQVSRRFIYQCWPPGDVTPGRYEAHLPFTIM